MSSEPLSRQLDQLREELDDALDDLPRYMAVSQPRT